MAKKIPLSTILFLVIIFYSACTGGSPYIVPCIPGTPDTDKRTVLSTLFSSGSWNEPASAFSVDTARAWMVQELYDNSTASRPGNFNLSRNEYTYPVYIADALTPRYEVISDNPSWGNIEEETVPYDQSWLPSAGSDGQVIIIDPETEKYYDLWQVGGWKFSSSRPKYNPPFKDGKLFVGNGNRIDNYESSNGISGSRGCGIAYFNLLVRPEEVYAGLITHALSMPIKNASPEFVAPAVKSDGQVTGGIPEGTRFVLTMTDEELNTWAAGKPAAYQQLALALGYALRDYGWIISDRSGGAFIQLEDPRSAGNLWSAMGIDLCAATLEEDPLRDLLDGLNWLGAVVLEAR